MKRRPNDFLAQYLGLGLNSIHAIRPEKEYRARSYNRARQVLALVDHLFVKYSVPKFLYRSILSFEGLELVFDAKFDAKDRQGSPPDSKYRDWFLAVAQGASFTKVTKDVFTKREAHLFLKAPDANGVEQNILWARAAAAGIPPVGCDYLVERLDAAFLRNLGDRLGDLLRFYASEWAKMRSCDRDEITDFVRGAVMTPSFSFKGRTFGSMRKLSHEWHRTAHVAYVREYRSWAAAIPNWEHVVSKERRLIRALELTSNRLLAAEGRKQSHCVFGYTMRCIQGMCRIVSVRWYAIDSEQSQPKAEISRVTLEISPTQRSVVQIRGRQNRRATDEEMKIIRLWAGANGLLVSPRW